MTGFQRASEREREMREGLVREERGGGKHLILDNNDTFHNTQYTIRCRTKKH
jgi:hypothetical protein